MKPINVLITILAVGSVVAFIFLAIFPPNERNKDIEKDEKIENEKTNDITMSIDSSMLQIDNMVQRFDCDTTTIGDFLDFTYEINERLSKSGKTRLFTIIVNDIYKSENDSFLVLNGTNVTTSHKDISLLSLSNICEFTIKDIKI